MGPFLSSFAQIDNEAFSSVCRGSHWLRVMTIESGCGLSHKSAEDGYKLRAVG